MVINYPGNTVDHLLVSFHRYRVGFTNYFIVHYNNSSSFCTTTKEVKSKYGKGKFTDSIKRLGVWCDEMLSTYGVSVEEGGEEEEVSLTDNTKMVV